MTDPANTSPDYELAKEIARRILAERQVLGGPSPTYEELVGRQYRIHPVDPATFLTQPEYAGRFGRNLYRKWFEELCVVLDPQNGITEWILTGAIGLGKSTVAALALAYKLYRLGCLINPIQFFNLMEGSGITFGVYSLFKYASQDNNYTTLKTMIDGIPFFRTNFPRARHLSSRAKDDLSFPNRVGVLAGSSELHALGLNLLCLLMDEVNFMRESKDNSAVEKVGQAQKLYTASLRRLESRFQYRGVTPGLMVLISSRNAESSWLELHLQEAIGKSGVHVSDYALWDVKREVMGYSGRRFYVEVGDVIHPSRIIEKLSDAREGSHVVSPPVEHKHEFEKDIEGALRDIAGVANVGISPLIKDREAMRATCDPKLFHPFTRTSFSITHLDDISIQSFFEAGKVVQTVRSFPRPRLNPGFTRFVHVDLAETGDAAGIAMGHVSQISGTSPRITIDLMLRLLAPSQGQIDFSKIIDFIVYLQQKCGYPIRSVSFDRFQSTHARQILAKLGFETPYLSVDKTDEPYLVLRSTIQEGRLSIYEYEPFLLEMSRLVHNIPKKKVDHPKGGSKDVSDAVCGVVYQLTKAIGEDPRIRNQSAGIDAENPAEFGLHPPVPVKSLAERLEEAGALASQAGRANRLV